MKNAVSLNLGFRPRDHHEYDKNYKAYYYYKTCDGSQQRAEKSFHGLMNWIKFDVIVPQYYCIIMKSTINEDHVECFIALGSNIGNRLENLTDAIERLSREAGPLLECSSIYLTEAWGVETQRPYLNVCVKIVTTLYPQDLLRVCMEIESSLGRNRKDGRWSPRTIDIDILYYGDRIISLPELKIPHPFISVRKFVLFPLAEIAPGWADPVSGVEVAVMKQNCHDRLRVKKMNCKIMAELGEV